MFDEVSANVNEIVQRQLSPLPEPEAKSQIATRADTVTDCSSTSQCLINGSKRKCWFGECVECHRHNQCVKDGKFRCNQQTNECESSNFIGAFVSRELAQQNIIQEVEKQEESVMELKTHGVPNLGATMR